MLADLLRTAWISGPSPAPPQSAFIAMLFANRALLQESYLAVALAAHEAATPSRAAACRHLAHPDHYPLCLGVDASGSLLEGYSDLLISERRLHAVESDQLAAEASQLVSDALRHGHGEPHVELAEALARALMAEFVDPIGWTNGIRGPHGRSFCPVTRHSADELLVVMDRVKIGVLLTADDE